MPLSVHLKKLRYGLFCRDFVNYIFFGFVRYLCVVLIFVLLDEMEQVDRQEFEEPSTKRRRLNSMNRINRIGKIDQISEINFGNRCLLDCIFEMCLNGEISEENIFETEDRECDFDLDYDDLNNDRINIPLHLIGIMEPYNIVNKNYNLLNQCYNKVSVQHLLESQLSNKNSKNSKNMKNITNQNKNKINASCISRILNNDEKNFIDSTTKLAEKKIFQDRRNDNDNNNNNNNDDNHLLFDFQQLNKLDDKFFNMANSNFLKFDNKEKKNENNLIGKEKSQTPVSLALPVIDKEFSLDSVENQTQIQIQGEKTQVTTKVTTKVATQTNGETDTQTQTKNEYTQHSIDAIHVQDTHAIASPKSTQNRKKQKARYTYSY